MRSIGWRPLLALAGTLILPVGLQAQQGFMFRQPAFQLTLRTGAAMARASGPAFDDLRDQLTLDTGDFAAQAFVAEALVRVHDAIDLGGGFQRAQSTANSEFRDFLYENDDPIRQTTRLARSALSLLVRAYPLGRGESLAEFAWVPKRFTPFVGGGGGVLWYRLRQNGDFVDKDTFDIFVGDYESSGSALATHLLAGADYWVTPAIALSAEGRYTMASDEPGGDYLYSNLDLSGLQLTAGLSFRF
jgi:opacity protein-like surface antigen